jgi:hypothetical protein
MDPGYILHKFLLEYERLHTMSPDVVRHMLYFESKCPLLGEKLSRRRGRKRKWPGAPTEIGSCLGKETPSH